MNVRATNLFSKNNVRPKELNHVPKTSEIFTVTSERAEELLALGYITIDEAVPNNRVETATVKKAVRKRVAKK